MIIQDFPDYEKLSAPDSILDFPPRFDILENMEEKININKLAELAEKLRENTVGNPVWVREKGVYEYANETIEVVVILKLLRAVQGIKGQLVLCNEGLLFDISTLYRCVNDCAEEIYFLLEKYPNQSSHVKQFIKNFFEHTIDSCASTETNEVMKKKIHSANVRCLTGQDINEDIRQSLSRIHKIYSGYVHASYSHIMQNYGGEYLSESFNLLGITSEQEKLKQSQIVRSAYITILLSMIYVCI